MVLRTRLRESIVHRLNRFSFFAFVLFICFLGERFCTQTHRQTAEHVFSLYAKLKSMHNESSTVMIHYIRQFNLDSFLANRQHKFKQTQITYFIRLHRDFIWVFDRLIQFCLWMDEWMKSVCVCVWTNVLNLQNDSNLDNSILVRMINVA